MNLIRLGLILLISFTLHDETFGQNCPALRSKKRLICYFASWAGNQRPSPANIQPEDFDPCMCTHVLYSFVNLRNSRLELTQTDRDLFPRMAKWKLKNPFLKISMSIGGWDEQSTHFIPMVATEENRKTFCQSVIDVSRTYSFDGIDIDWEYPSDYQRAQYTATIQTCFDMFTQEASSSGKTKLLITAATAPDGRMYALDIPALNRLMDFVMPMTYDIHGSWDGNSAHHSPLYGWGGADGTLQNYINAGMSPSKLNLGLAGYGRATAEPGPYTREGGVLAYYEVCLLLCKNWRNIDDDYIKAPKAVNGNGYGHVFYDNTKSMFDKANYVMNSQIGGAFIWDTSLDDFRGDFCCQGTYPLIRTVLNVFLGNSTYPTNLCCNSAQTTTTTVAPTTSNNQGGGMVTNPTTSNSPPSVVVYGGCTAGKQFAPHMTDCNKFLKCERIENTDTYTETVETCPGGTLFDPNLSLCNWPQNVICQTYTYTTAPATTTTKNKINGCDGTQQYATHPTDCTKMISCSTGTELSCVEGLSFDYSSQKCINQPNCNPVTTTLATTIVATTTLATTTTATTIPPTTPAVFYVVCSPNGKIFYPHPTDCNKLIKCELIENTDQYTTIIQTCPGGTLFNPDLQVCDWPQNVVCKTYSYVTEVLTTTPAVTSSISGCNNGKTYAKHPTDCTKMIACSNGAELVCVTGLAFDYASQQCLSASSLNCEATTTTAATTTTSVNYSLCPSSQRFSAHRTDCSKFMQCEKSTNGDYVETEIMCPGGLLFNSNLLVCDWPHNVVCDLTGTGPTKPTTPFPLGPSNEYVCLKDGLFPSPLLCSVYYECIDGKATKATCPMLGSMATVFDMYKKICSFKSSASIFPDCI